MLWKINCLDVIRELILKKVLSKLIRGNMGIIYISNKYINLKGQKQRNQRKVIKL
jgi:hypothetical protein